VFICFVFHNNRRVPPFSRRFRGPLGLSILSLEFPDELFLPVRRQLFQFGLQLGHRGLEPYPVRANTTMFRATKPNPIPMKSKTNAPVVAFWWARIDWGDASITRTNSQTYPGHAVIEGKVHRRERLGGLLNNCYRKAA
jgi:hypothetical protein